MEQGSVNSKAYWERRFDEDWEAAGGPQQSRFFARLLATNLPDWCRRMVQTERLTVCDWGCATGDGTDVLASYFGRDTVTGVDFAENAVESARHRYPDLEFRAEDWASEESARERFDVVVSSNTLEHFPRPQCILSRVAERATSLVILLIPYRELERLPEHRYTFVAENIPFCLGGHWVLVHAKVIDARSTTPCYWPGDQILLIYARQQTAEAVGLKLADVDIASEHEGAPQTQVLQAQLAEKEQAAQTLQAQLAGREQTVEQLQSQLAQLKAEQERLTQQVAERDGQIANLNQTVAERDLEIRFLQNQVQNVLMSTSWRITRPLRFVKDLVLAFRRQADSALEHIPSGIRKAFHYGRRSLYLVRSGGFPALYSAIHFKVKANARQRSVQREMDGRQQRSREPPKSQDHLIGSPLGNDMVIFTAVPYDDIGGGQRPAQLARCALKTGRKVLYVYLYYKFDFERACHVDSIVDIGNLTHRHLSDLSPSAFLDGLTEDTTVVFEFPHPDFLQYLQIAKRRGIRTVFELIDDWDSSLGDGWFNDFVMQQFIDMADVVIGTAKVLQRILVERGRTDALYLPNAANEYLFDKHKTYSRPSDMPPGTVGLYFGSLYGDWFAWDYLYTAARNNPNINFALIGGIHKEKTFDAPRNIYFLGAKMIEELPAYLNCSTFCLLPFTPGKISDAVSPIKIFEYLFMGKPVVSTALPEIRGYPGVYVAEGVNEFSRLCAEVSSNANPVSDDMFIARNSWCGRVQQLCGTVGEKNVTAIVLIHNNRSLIERCLTSLIEHCESYLAQVIVVDNASTDGGADHVRRIFSHVDVVRNDVNGCASGRNRGMRMASGRYVAFFDSDQWFTSSACFAEALSILKRRASIGAVSWSAGWFDKSRTDCGGPTTDCLPDRGMNRRALEIGYREDVGYLGTGGFFAPRSVIEAVGGFDEFYDPTCFEDTDISFAIKKLGLTIVYRDLTGIRHQCNQTTKASGSNAAYLKLFNRNAKYFQNKWKDYPEFFVEYREE